MGVREECSLWLWGVASCPLWPVSLSSHVLPGTWTARLCARTGHRRPLSSLGLWSQGCCARPSHALSECPSVRWTGHPTLRGFHRIKARLPHGLHSEVMTPVEAMEGRPAEGFLGVCGDLTVQEEGRPPATGVSWWPRERQSLGFVWAGGAGWWQEERRGTRSDFPHGQGKDRLALTRAELCHGGSREGCISTRGGLLP